MHDDAKPAAGRAEPVAGVEDATPKALGSVRLMHANGLHARPAIKLTKLAKNFAANIRVGLAGNGPWTDVKSIARVMALKIPSGVTLFFEAEGRDARSAVDSLVALVDSDFSAGEAP